MLSIPWKVKVCVLSVILVAYLHQISAHGHNSTTIYGANNFFLCDVRANTVQSGVSAPLEQYDLGPHCGSEYYLVYCKLNTFHVFLSCGVQLVQYKSLPAAVTPLTRRHLQGGPTGPLEPPSLNYCCPRGTANFTSFLSTSVPVAANALP